MEYEIECNQDVVSIKPLGLMQSSAVRFEAFLKLYFFFQNAKQLCVNSSRFHLHGFQLGRIGRAKLL